jgi:hypothetical protein
MLLQIYNLIVEMEKNIGDGSQVRIQTEHDNLIIRVDWWVTDFHFMRMMSKIELSTIVDDSILVAHFVKEAKYRYQNRGASL